MTKQSIQLYNNYLSNYNFIEVPEAKALIFISNYNFCLPMSGQNHIEHASSSSHENMQFINENLKVVATHSLKQQSMKGFKIN
ncbi:CLUMA_CG020638, isoform A [Clunio marinus]|uniref:CLUMA_CG020638, isoform A n=1 Tax=Clunio marinus TaxID=568069 RepID=A0A1J1J9J2_9DIPT|nr:CLUMA_CG020638, isoform A [Clunio marinus]